MVLLKLTYIYDIWNYFRNAWYLHYNKNYHKDFIAFILSNIEKYKTMKTSF